MATLTVDLTSLPAETRLKIRDTLAREDCARMAVAAVEQARIKKLYEDAVAPGTTKDGIGPCSMAIHPYWASYFRRLHGDEIFQDENFVQWLKKQHDGVFAVRETGTRIQVGYRAGSQSKFHKTYPSQPHATSRA